MRTSPNVIITGTPGVGKTVHCEQLAEETGLRHLSINHVAKERDCYETYDHELQTWVVDEDKVRSCNAYIVWFPVSSRLPNIHIAAPGRYRGPSTSRWLSN